MFGSLVMQQIFDNCELEIGPYCFDTVIRSPIGLGLLIAIFGTIGFGIYAIFRLSMKRQRRHAL